MNILIELKIVTTIAIMLLIPGWAFLSVTGIWKNWNPMQRWFLALGIGISFYPILFYLSRAILPALHIGERKLWVVLLIMFLTSVWFLRNSWQEQFELGKWGGVILAVLAATLFTRLWLAHLYPYPAWTDSLHHTLLTNLVSVNGILPYDLTPYAPTSLAQYHLGLYALTGSLQILADIPAHTALLWMSQTLNGLCVIGIFLFLDKKVSRLAALVGMIVVGLLSFQPAWYFNWGRFTQISSQSLFLIAAITTWEAMDNWKNDWPDQKPKIYFTTFLAGILNAAVFLLHYRAAGYLLPLLAIICIYEIIGNIQEKRHFIKSITGVCLIAIISFSLILPALIPAFEVYYDKRVVEVVKNDETSLKEPIPTSENPYFSNYNLESVWSLSSKKWLIALAGAGAFIGLLGKKRSLTIITLLWCFALVLEGLAYKLNIPLLAFTNITGMMIMLYMPVGLLVGLLVHESFSKINEQRKSKIEPIFLWFLLFAGFIGSFYRLTDVEQYRQFMTNQDQMAMEWIKDHTPRNAVFAIHTYYWLPNSAHGSEAGYWIPYFAERKTTTDTMISSLGPKHDMVINRSNAVMSLYTDQPAIDKLCELGVNYLYDGNKEAFDNKSFNLEAILTFPNVKPIYENNNVLILKLCK